MKNKKLFYLINAALFFACLTSWAIEATPATIIKPLIVIGNQGVNDGEFNEPRDCAFDDAGNLWVADFRNYRVQKLTPQGKHLLTVGEKGSQPLQFMDPTGISSSSKFIYIADTWNHRLQVLDSSGNFVRSYQGGFFAPKDVALAPDGEIYVSDTGNGRIVVLSQDGRVLRTISKKGNAKGELLEPVGLAIASKGDIIIFDAGNKRLQRLGEDGKPLMVIDLPQKRERHADAFVTLDAKGFIYATDPVFSRVLIFKPDGSLHKAFGAFGREPGQFDRPAGIAISKDGKLLAVCDTWNHRMQLFSTSDIEKLPVYGASKAGWMFLIAVIIAIASIALFSFIIIRFVSKWRLRAKEPDFEGIEDKEDSGKDILEPLPIDMEEEETEPARVSDTISSDETVEISALEFPELADRLKKKRHFVGFLELFYDRWYLFFPLVITMIGLAVAGQLFIHFRWSVKTGAILYLMDIPLVIIYALSRRKEGIKGVSIPLKVEAILIVLIMIIAIFFRVYQLPEFPWGLNNDEAWDGVEALQMLEGKVYRPLTNQRWDIETLFFYLLLPPMILFGANYLSMRLVPVTIGILTVFVFYRLLRRIFDQRLALLATLFIALCTPHVIYSRTVWRVTSLPLVQAAMFLFLYRATRSASLRDYIYFGGFLGLIFNTYSSAKITPLLLGIYWIYILFKQRGEFIRRHLPKILVSFMIAAIAASPLIVYGIYHPNSLFGRTSGHLFITNQVHHTGDWSPLWNNVVHFFSTYIYRSGPGSFNEPEHPILSPYVAPFFILGLVFFIFYLNKTGYFLLYIWFWLYALPGILSESPLIQRILGSVLPGMIIGIVFGVILLRDILSRLKIQRQWVQNIALILAGIVLLSSQYKLIFVVYKNAFHFQYGYFPHINEVCYQARDEYLKGNQVYLSEIFANHDTCRFVNFYASHFHYQWRSDSWAKVYNMFDPGQDVLIHKDPGKGASYLLNIGGAELEYITRIFRSYYPGVRIDPIKHPLHPDTTIAWRFNLTPGQIEQLQGLNVEIIDPDDQTKDTGVIKSLNIRNLGQAFDLSSDGSRIRIFGSLILGRIENYAFKLDTSASCRILLDDELLLETKRRTSQSLDEVYKQRLMGMGLHKIEIIIEDAVANDRFILKMQQDNVPVYKDIPHWSLCTKPPQPGPFMPNRISTIRFKLIAEQRYSGPGIEDRHCRGPKDVVVNDSGEVFMADSTNFRVKVFSAGGKLERLWGRKGKESTDFSSLFRLSMDANGNLYVVDMLFHKIHKYDQQGRFLGFVDCGHLRGPFDMVFNSKGDAMISNYNRGNVIICSPNGKSRSVTKIDSFFGKFVSPAGVAVDKHDRFYVVDDGTKSIVLIDKNGNLLSETFLSKIDKYSSLMLTDDGFLFVFCPKSNRIFVFDDKMNLLLDPSSRNFDPFDNLHLRFPIAGYEGSDGKIYIVSSDADTIIRCRRAQL